MGKSNEMWMQDDSDPFIRRVQAVTVAVVAVLVAIVVLGAFAALIYSMATTAGQRPHQEENQAELHQNNPQ